MKRIDWIDIAKGLGMLAIIWGHICCKGWSNNLVYSFHIPLFFFLSGLVYNNAKYTSFVTFVKNRAKRLLLPYFIYSVVTWAIWAAFTYVTHRPCDDFFAPLLQTFIAQGSGGFLVHNVALWFIPCLFFVELIYYPIGKYKLVGAKLLICCAIACMGMVFEHLYGKSYLDTLPWNLDSAFMAMPFYCIGNLIGVNQKIYNKVSHAKLTAAAVVVVLTASLQWAANKWGAISMGHSFFGNEYVFHIRGLLGCFSTLLFAMLLSALLGSNKVFDKIIHYIKWVGKNSLDVMATNNPIKGFICTIIALVWHIKTADASFVDIPTSLVAFVFTLIIDTTLVWLIVYARKRNWFINKNS